MDFIKDNQHQHHHYSLQHHHYHDHYNLVERSKLGGGDFATVFASLQPRIRSFLSSVLRIRFILNCFTFCQNTWTCSILPNVFEMQMWIYTSCVQFRHFQIINLRCKDIITMMDVFLRLTFPVAHRHASGHWTGWEMVPPDKGKEKYSENITKEYLKNPTPKCLC